MVGEITWSIGRRAERYMVKGRGGENAKGQKNGEVMKSVGRSSGSSLCLLRIRNNPRQIGVVEEKKINHLLIPKSLLNSFIP